MTSHSTGHFLFVLFNDKKTPHRLINEVLSVIY